ncbi:beta-galactosidase [Leifsonia sp. EB41]|uniref:glycoside hydrolase family 35 protein n=1 Tax=Leifsonia sp. EB41 TaxID=3156260 RepID=UPI0035136829
MTVATSAAILNYSNGALLRDGVEHRVLSGSLHYFRVHPALWRDRLERIAALGLNTVDTYVAWNFHQRRAEQPADFSGWRDLERFVRLAGELGLDVIVRPGPYICAEWDNGGFPAWLTARSGRGLRSSDPLFLDAVAEWFDDLIPRLVSLQASHGGPIVAMQVENEYGSYGDDGTYLAWLRDALIERGVTELLYTADGPTDLMLDGGSIPGVLATATFGSRATQAIGLLRSRRNGEPFICAEYWNGWFDHWGERHHVRSVPSADATLAEILELGGSVSLYMAHGGTNFGLWAGANHDGALQPTITSYDSDAPVAEHGALTAKFMALRERLTEFTGVLPPAPPAAPPVLAPRAISVESGRALLESLGSAAAGIASTRPLSFEQLGLPSGLVLYSARPRLPRGSTTLTITGLHDRAQVFVDGVPAGVISDETGTLELVGTGAPVELQILVENQGRINYGPLLGQGKGILGGVQVGRRLVHGWTMRALPLDEWSPAMLRQLASTPESVGARISRAPGFATAQVEITEPADTFLALPGFRKGFVWVNGFLVGRYWDVGPQLTLYVPAPLLTSGVNTITVLELEQSGDRIEFRGAPELGPTEEYIETFDDE